MAAWNNFYTLTGESAATLVGLMFIAVTFGQKLVTPKSIVVAREFLSPIFLHFGHVLLLSCVAVLPIASSTPLAVVAIVVALLRAKRIPVLAKVMKQQQGEKRDVESSDFVYNLYLPMLLYAGFIAGGVAELMSQPWALVTMGVATIVTLILGVIVAWDTLIWMASRVE